jgi:Family of unknown function (DUF5689)/Domain of unknown function (DUF5017)
MKTTFFKSAFFIVLSAGIVTSCVKDDNYSTPDLTACTETSLVKNREVAQINATAIVAVHSDIVAGVSDVIEAYVTSSDIGGNFFKSISMQTLDGTKAFSIPVDATSTFIDYEPGRKVLINMDGLYTDIKYGGMRIGSLYGNSSGGAEVGRLSLSDFRKSVKHSCAIVNEDQLVKVTTIDQAMNDSYLNKLIEFNNVEFSNTDILTTYYDPNNDLGGATNHTLMDLQGNSVIFRTSSYSNFAAKAVATGSGKVRGIMTKYGTDYQFMVRSEGDIDMTGTRFSPLLNESFSTGFSNWVNYSVSGAQVWAYSSTFGNPGACAKMSGYATTNNTNEDWLISPSQNLSSLSSATVSFDNAYKFTGDPIQILVSNNYSGSGDPYATGVTWTTLIGATLSSGNYAWASSGALDISTFTGVGNEAIYIAFKYNSSTSAGSTWELDNVKIAGN